jgi:hypothetical protein
MEYRKSPAKNPSGGWASIVLPRNTITSRRINAKPCFLVLFLLAPLPRAQAAKSIREFNAFESFYSHYCAFSTILRRPLDPQVPENAIAFLSFD